MTVSLIQGKPGYAKGVLHVIIYLHEIKMLQEKEIRQYRVENRCIPGLQKENI